MTSVCHALKAHSTLFCWPLLDWEDWAIPC